MQQILYFIAWILFPLIPAFFCYKVLKVQNISGESTGVTGTLWGLKIETGGAFAIYFILFICIHYYFGNRFLDSVDKDIAYQQETKHMWLVKCKIDLVEKDNKTELSNDEFNESFQGFNMQYIPPNYSKKDNGEIDFYLPNELLNASTATVEMDVPGFRHLSLHTSDFDVHKNIDKSTIDLGIFKLGKTNIYKAGHFSKDSIVSNVNQLPKPNL